MKQYFNFKNLAIVLICVCAVFVSLMFSNLFLDLNNTDMSLLNLQETAFLEAQKDQCLIVLLTGGVTMSGIAIVMVVFFIRNFIKKNESQMGILKAIGYSNFKIALFNIKPALVAVVGCWLGYIIGILFLPTFYNLFQEDFPYQVAYNFQIVNLLVAIIGPAILFPIISFLYAFMALRKPALLMIRKTKNMKFKKKEESISSTSFEKEMMFNSLRSNISLVIFVLLGSFSFSAMIQMAISMVELEVSGVSVAMIGVIGAILGTIAVAVPIDALAERNAKPIALLKSFGYSEKKCTLLLFAPYLLVAFLGFVFGTLYQFGLLSFIVNVTFKNTEGMPIYNFSLIAFFVTMIAVILAFALFGFIFARKMSKVSFREVMVVE
jgi:predicted lysophospholipase L1 biosynthesis ABC-type transport system permease subunit